MGSGVETPFSTSHWGPLSS